MIFPLSIYSLKDLLGEFSRKMRLTWPLPSWYFESSGEGGENDSDQLIAQLVSFHCMSTEKEETADRVIKSIHGGPSSFNSTN